MKLHMKAGLATAFTISLSAQERYLTKMSSATGSGRYEQTVPGIIPVHVQEVPYICIYR